MGVVRKCAGGRRVPNVDVNSSSEGPGMGGRGSKVVPGRGMMRGLAIVYVFLVV